MLTTSTVPAAALPPVGSARSAPEEAALEEVAQEEAALDELAAFEEAAFVEAACELAGATSCLPFLIGGVLRKSLRSSNGAGGEPRGCRPDGGALR